MMLHRFKVSITSISVLESLNDWSLQLEGCRWYRLFEEMVARMLTKKGPCCSGVQR